MGEVLAPFFKRLSRRDDAGRCGEGQKMMRTDPYHKL
jgi:hypothetical protein